MNTAQIQAALNARGVKPLLATDGVAGRKTLAAIDAALVSIPNTANWTDARKLVAVEQIIYRDAGIEVGTIDGFVGEQTRYARTVYDGRLKGDTSAETWRDQVDKTPSPLPTASAASKWPTEAAVETLFGKPGSNQVKLELPFAMRIAWEPTQQVSRVSCHELVSAALGHIWHNALSHYGLDRIRELRLDMFGGCLNVRKKRGGSGWSMHAYGIAWDIDPDRNQLKWHRELATLDDAPYDDFWQIVESEGGVSLGRQRDFDWMHLQFARL